MLLDKLISAYNYFHYVKNCKKGNKSNIIETPLSIEGVENISLGENCFIKKNAYIIVKPLTGEPSSEFIMGNNSHLNYGCHVVATKRIVIGDNCSISPYVYISDNLHGYENPDVAPKFQPIRQLKEVRIGNDTWVGTRVCICGCTIGKHCVIGANTFVNKDIPDYSIVGGIPARILKRYNPKTQKWEKTDKLGNFLDE